MDSKNIHISVIVPAYNVELFLERCIDSIIDQSLSDIEIILIDNGSTDSTREIIKKYSNKDSRIIPIYCDKNIKPSGARNKGLEIAKGKYIFFCDGDDSIPHDGLKSLFDTAETAMADAVVGNYNFIDSKVHFKQVCAFKTAEQAYLHERVIWTILFKRDAVKSILFQPYAYGEDTLYLIEAFPFLNNIAVTQDVIYNHFANIVEGKIMSLTQHLAGDDVLEYIVVLYKMMDIISKNKNKWGQKKQQASESLVLSYYVHLIGYWFRVNTYDKMTTFPDLKKAVLSFNWTEISSSTAFFDIFKVDIQTFKSITFQGYISAHNWNDFQQNGGTYWNFRNQCRNHLISFKSALICTLLTIPHIRWLGRFYRKIKNILNFSRKVSPRTRVKSGFKLLKKIQKKHGIDTHIILNPFPGMGDIFLMAKHLPEYLTKNGIEKYVFIVPGNAAYKACRIYEELILEKISCEEMDDLVKAVILAGEKNLNAKIFHHHILEDKTSLGDRGQGMNGLNMKDMLVNIVMGISGNGEKLIPNFKTLTEFDKSTLFEKNNLLPGKTVILAPYANSNGKYSNDFEFWNILAAALIKRGFTVCTNCVGSQQPVENTVAVSFPLEIGLSVLEYAGYFIAWRSGLCDVLGDARCKKIVLYDSDFKIGLASYKDYYSIEKLGLGSNVIELSVKLSNWQESLDTVRENTYALL